jgi:hypothetical protein
MPRYDFQCEKGHKFERDLPLAQFDYAQRCACGAAAKMFLPRGPIFNASVMAADREAYMQHNITFTGGTAQVQHTPNPRDQQCQCGGCKRHRRRAGVTGTAEPARRNRRVLKEVRV